MGTMHVACAADAAYTPYCATMLHALLQSQQGHQEVCIEFLCDTSFPAALLRRLEGFVQDRGGNFNALPVATDRTARLPQMPRIPRIMWLRVLLPELCPSLDRILYLDIDTLPLEPLDTLWEMKLDDHLVAAVDNVLEPRMASHPATLGIPPERGYFNSGVLLMNLAQMRREGSTDSIMKLAASPESKLVWPDQDALNLVLGPRRKRLHPRWNCQNSFFYWRQWSVAQLGAEEVNAATRAPAIIHFEGPGWAKPWHYLNHHPYKKIWENHQRDSGWPAPPPAGRTLKNLAKRSLPPALWTMLRRLAVGRKGHRARERQQ